MTEFTIFSLFQIEPGALDGLVRLEFLDLSENPIENYTTNSWTFCHGIEYGYGDLMKGIEVFQDFSRDDKFGDDYCLNWLEHHPSRLALDRGNF